MYTSVGMIVLIVCIESGGAIPPPRTRVLESTNCPNGFYRKFTMDGSHCARCVEGCKRCDNDSSCLECRVRHAISEDGTSCVECAGGCTTCAFSDTSFCTSCPVFSPLKRKEGQCVHVYRYVIMGLCAMCAVMFVCAVCIVCCFHKDQAEETGGEEKTIFQVHSNILQCLEEEERYAAAEKGEGEEDPASPAYEMPISLIETKISYEERDVYDSSLAIFNEIVFKNDDNNCLYLTSNDSAT